MLGQRDFDLFKLDKRKKLVAIPVGSRDARSLWEHKYQGVFVVQQTSVQGNGPYRQVPDNSELVLERALVTYDTQDTSDTTVSLQTSAGEELAHAMPPSISSAPTNQPMPSSSLNVSNNVIELSIVGRNATEQLLFGINCRPQDVYISFASKFDFIS